MVLAMLGARGMYSQRLRSHLLDEIRQIVSATSVATMAVITFAIIVVDDPHTSGQTVQAWVLATLFLSAGRTGLFISRSRAIARGEGRATLIVGAGKVGHLVARRLTERPEFGLQPVGFLDNDPLVIEGRATALPVLGASWDLERILEENDVEHVIFTFSTAPHAVMLNMVRRCRELGVSASLVPRLFEVSVERVTVEHLGGLPLLEMRPIDPKGWQFLVKYALDRVVAGIGILLISPILLTLTAAVLITSGRPIFFRQRRIGLDGQEFDMLKFRTMKGSPESSGHNHGHWVFETLEEGDSLLAAPEAERKRQRQRQWQRQRHAVVHSQRRTRNGGVATATADRDHRRGRRPDLGRGPAHPDRPDPAPLLSGRASAADQRLPGRHVADRPPAGAGHVRAALRGGRPPVRGSSPGQVGYHGLGPGTRPARQHLTCRPGGMGQLLHRELVPMARHEDRRDDGGLAPALAGGLSIPAVAR